MIWIRVDCKNMLTFPPVISRFSVFNYFLFIVIILRRHSRMNMTLCNGRPRQDGYRKEVKGMTEGVLFSRQKREKVKSE